MKLSLNTTSTCPMCFKTGKPRIKTHEIEDSDKIVVVELCAFCRNEHSRRISTEEIEKIRRDILRLTKRVELGETFLVDTLNRRITRYNILRANLNRDENN